MVITKTILILEDDLKTLSKLLAKLAQLEVDKVIAISSVPKYNAQLKDKGVTRVVLKDYQYLDKFAEDVVKLIEEAVRKMPLIED